MRFFKHHTLRIFLVALFVLAVGCSLVALYWTIRPADRLRSERILHYVATSIRYGRTNGPGTQQATATEVPILLYHGILKGPNDSFSITQKDFDAQMVALKRAGYSSVTTQQYLDFVSGKHSLPAKSVMITFDDGRKDSFYRADPILRTLGFKAVMYLTSGYSIVDGSKYYLDRDELLTMDKTGRWDIEAHADYAGTNQIVIDADGNKGNFFGNLKWLTGQHRIETYEEYRLRVATEMDTVKRELTELLGQGSITTLAFPFGDYGQRNKDSQLSTILLNVAHDRFKQVYAQFRKGEPYSSNYEGNKAFISRRIEVNPNLTGQGLVDTLSESIAKPSNYHAELSAKEGWQSDWGNISFARNQMAISSDKDATGATVYLDGTKTFSSYRVVTTVHSLDSDNESLEVATLFQSSKSYVGCIFYSNRVKLERVSDGIRTVLGEYDMTPDYRNQAKLGIATDGKGVATCSVDGKEVLQGQTPLDGVMGGPALIVRQSRPGRASVIIDSFELKKS